MTDNELSNPADTPKQAAGNDRLVLGIIIGMLITLALIAAVLLVNARVSAKILTILLLAAGGYVGIAMNRMILGLLLAALGTAFGVMIV